jgi:PAS domain S-box-containing protein
MAVRSAMARPFGDRDGNGSLPRDSVAGDDIMVDAGSHILMRQAEFLDGFPAALFRSTLEGTIVYCNRCFAGLFGYDSVKALIGSPEVALYRNMKDRGYLVDSLLQQGRLYDIPIGFRKRDGSDLSCAVTVRGVFDDDGMVVHVDGLLRDITTEIVYSQAQPPLDDGFDQGEKFQGAQEMAGGVAHHLNQPLTIVNNLLNELLTDALVEGPCFDRILKVQQQVNRMIAITRKIAAIKRYESMDYVAGVKIVDIEKSILTKDGEDRA